MDSSQWIINKKHLHITIQAKHILYITNTADIVKLGVTEYIPFFTRTDWLIKSIYVDGIQTVHTWTSINEKTKQKPCTYESNLI